MSKIIRFLNPLTDELKADEMDFEQRDCEHVEANRRGAADGGWTLWIMVRVLLKIVRMPVFLVLYFLRAPVMMMCSMLYLPLFLLALFAWYAFPKIQQM